MPNLEEIAEGADVIINGYAFTRDGEAFRVLNLNRPTSAAVLGATGEVWETTMDDIELSIVREYLARSLKYMAA